MHPGQCSSKALELRPGIRGADRDIPVGGRVLILKRIRTQGELFGHHESAAGLHGPGAKRIGLLYGGPFTCYQWRFRGDTQLTDLLGMLVLEGELLNVIVHLLQPLNRRFRPIGRGLPPICDCILRHPDGGHIQGQFDGNGPSVNE